jgi:hypothetical protein
VKNGDEIAVDCGGGCQCQLGQPCDTPADCLSSICTAGKCQPPNCTDSLKNGNESDVDCGGLACPKCDDLKACALPTDCKSEVCTGSICQAPTCVDLVKNGMETDVDCGSTCPNPCGDGLGCATATDCSSGICQTEKCVPASCTDQIENGTETDIDCGGACGACPDGKGCAASVDCQSHVCTANVCQVPSCTDGAQNGTETDVDCGGAACVLAGNLCADTQTCGVAADCSSGVCLGSVCLTPTCSDLVENGSESDVDCGGVVCPFCDAGQSCNAGSDCATGGCTASVCGSWAKQFGNTEADVAYAVAVDSQGDIFVAGWFALTVSFGGPTLSASGTADGFVVKLSRTGQHLWTKQLTGSGADVIVGLAVDANDDVVMVGTALSSNISGGPPLTSNGAQDIFIAKLAGTDGSHVWSKLAGGALTDQGSTVALDSAGDVIVTGWGTSSSLTFGGPTFTGQGNFDTFVVKYSGVDGAHIWSKAFGGPGVDSLLSASADASGDVFLAGRFQGSVSFGGAPLTSNGFSDIVVLKLLGTDGSHAWSSSHGAANDDFGRVVLADSLGNVVMAGTRTGAVDFGGGPLPAYGQVDLALARYAGGSGAHQWSSGPGGSLLDSLTDMDRDGNDYVVVGGYRSSNLNFGGGALPATPVVSLFAAAISGATGVPSASKAFAATGADAVPNAVAVNPTTRALVVVGNFAGTLDLDGAQLTTAGKDDIFVGSLVPLN